MNAKTLSRLSLGSTAGVEAVASFQRFNERQTTYIAAMAAATRQARQLVVIGDPDAGLQTRVMRAYGCGDLCLDLNGCPSCPTSAAVNLDAAGTVQSPVAAGSAVVYCSCVLEYVDNPISAWNELVRMAGDQSNVYLVTVQWWSPASVLYPGAKWRVTRTPTGISVSSVGTLEKAVWWSSIALSGLYAI